MNPSRGIPVTCFPCLLNSQDLLTLASHQQQQQQQLLLLQQKQLHNPQYSLLLAAGSSLSTPRPLHLSSGGMSTTTTVAGTRTSTLTGSGMCVMNDLLSAAWQQALAAIAWSDQHDFDMACHREPQLIQDKTPLEHFVQFAQEDSGQHQCIYMAVAHQLMAYWKCREHIFGPECAYWPLTLLPHLALGSVLLADDVALIQGGFIAHGGMTTAAAAWVTVGAAPPPPPHRTMLICDAAHCTTSIDDVAVRLQATFYHVHQCMAKHHGLANEKDGIVVLCLISLPHHYNHSMIECHCCWMICFPFVFKPGIF